MKLQTLRDNLKNTIKHKEDLLEVFKSPENYDWLSSDEKIARDGVNAFLKINIEELKTILTDVELCMNDKDANSWITSPDRMGGQFTDEEIRRAGDW